MINPLLLVLFSVLAAASRQHAAGGAHMAHSRRFLKQHSDMVVPGGQPEQTAAEKVDARSNRKLHEDYLPDIQNVANGDCSGYPDTRRYIEVQSWWTDERTNLINSSRHAHMGACVPTEPITDDITIDLVLRLHNQDGTGRYIGAFYINIGWTELASEWEVGFFCPGSDCVQTFRVPLNITGSLPGNGNTTLVIGGSLRTPLADRVPGNEFATYEVKLPVVVAVKEFEDYWTNDLETGVTALSWARRPWQYAVIGVDALPSADSVSGVVPLKMWLNADVRKEEEVATNLTSLLVAVDPVFHPTNTSNITLGSVVMRFDAFSHEAFPETAFIDTRRLQNGVHKVFIRVDAFISADSLPPPVDGDDWNAPPLSKLGGTNSAVLLFYINVQNW